MAPAGVHFCRARRDGRGILTSVLGYFPARRTQVPTLAPRRAIYVVIPMTAVRSCGVRFGKAIIGCLTRVDRHYTTRETASLIGSDKVEGTPVYRSNGERVGQIERVMIDKINGKVAYAVMSFGGFMGIGEDYYPLPWSLLTYNPRLEGYEVNVSEEQLIPVP